MLFKGINPIKYVEEVSSGQAVFEMWEYLYIGNDTVLNFYSHNKDLDSIQDVSYFQFQGKVSGVLADISEFTMVQNETNITYRCVLEFIKDKEIILTYFDNLGEVLSKNTLRRL